MRYWQDLEEAADHEHVHGRHVALLPVMPKAKDAQAGTDWLTIFLCGFIALGVIILALANQRSAPFRIGGV